MLGGIGTAVARAGRALERRPAGAPAVRPRASGGVGGSLFGGGAGGGTSGSELAQVSSNSTLFSVVDLKASAVASVDWYLERVPRPNADPDVPAQRVNQHAVLDLLATPNPVMTRQELFEVSEQHYSLVGEVWWLVVRAGVAGASSLPMELWPLRPDQITIEAGKAQPGSNGRPGRPAGVPVGYTYTDADGDRIPLLLDDVVFMRRPDPRDPFGRGIGPVQALLGDLDSMRYSVQWNRKFFQNDATPGGVVEFEDNLSDPQYDDFVKRWREQHQGVGNAFRVALLEKAKYTNTGFSQKDMQFVELRNIGRELVQEAFRIHDHMLGKSADVNLANAQASEYTFSKWTLVPDLERFKGGLNVGLLPMYNNGRPAPVQLQYCSPVQEDADSKRADETAAVANFVSLVSAGVDPAAAAELVGFPDLPMTADVVSIAGK